MVKLTAFPATVASLCCLSPIILLSLGIVSVSTASELADVLYGEYRWAFRGAGLAALIVFVVSYFRKKGICTLDDAGRRKNEVVNVLLLSFFTAVVLYIVFLYGIVEIIGEFLSVW